MSTQITTITILVDNRGAPGLVTEHGLSLHIRTAGHNLLFDTGQSDACTINSRILGLDLGEIDAIVLSHGHYDHTGGLAQVLGLPDGRRCTATRRRSHPATRSATTSPNRCTCLVRPWQRLTGCPRSGCTGCSSPCNLPLPSV